MGRIRRRWPRTKIVLPWGYRGLPRAHYDLVRVRPSRLLAGPGSRHARTLAGALAVPAAGLGSAEVRVVSVAHAQRLVAQAAHGAQCEDLVGPARLQPVLRGDESQCRPGVAPTALRAGLLRAGTKGRRWERHSGAAAAFVGTNPTAKMWAAGAARSGRLWSGCPWSAGAPRVLPRPQWEGEHRSHRSTQ